MIGKSNLNFVQDFRKKGYGKFFYNGLETIIKDTTQTDELGIACSDSVRTVQT